MGLKCRQGSGLGVASNHRQLAIKSQAERVIINSTSTFYLTSEEAEKKAEKIAPWSEPSEMDSVF